MGDSENFKVGEFNFSCKSEFSSPKDNWLKCDITKDGKNEGNIDFDVYRGKTKAEATFSKNFLTTINKADAETEKTVADLLDFMQHRSLDKITVTLPVTSKKAQEEQSSKRLSRLQDKYGAVVR